MSDQSHLDSDVQQLTTFFGQLQTEIASLKAQPGATAMDFSGLDNITSQIGSLVPTQADPSTPATTDPTTPSTPDPSTTS